MRAILQQLKAQWGNARGSELAAIVALLRAVYQTHQTAHWQSGGANYYGDHLLFQRLYEAILPEIDSVAERAIGTGGTSLLDGIKQATQTAEIVTLLRGAPASSPKDLVAISLNAEVLVLEVLAEALSGRLSQGQQNLLQGIADTHEGHVYLLQQRLAQG